MLLELPEVPTPDPGAVPREVEMILSAMDAAHSSNFDRRSLRRMPYRTSALLKLFSENDSDEPITLYTRDCDSRGFGFITRHRLPLGYGGMVELIDPTGRKLKVQCTLVRCRIGVQGWYEGALSFNRDISQFDPKKWQ